MKKSITAILCLTLVAAAAVFAFGCGDSVRTDPVYSVYVTGGTGAGRYYENDNCKVVAAVPEGKQFIKWTRDGNDVAADTEYVFKVTADTELVAVFGDEVDYVGKEVFTVKTENGVGDGGYIEGSECTVKLIGAESDRRFAGWAAVAADGTVGEIVSTQNPYTFKVTADVSLSARFADVRLDTPFATLSTISSTPSWGDVIVELDRVKDANGNAVKDEAGNPVSVFDGRVQYVKILIYDSVYGKTPIAALKFVQNADKTAKLTSMDGEHEFDVVGGAGNYYRDWINMADWLAFFKPAVGTSYASDTVYYFASQLIAADEAVQWGEDGEPQFFADSGISALSGSHFCELD